MAEVAYLSPAWCDLVASAGAGLPERSGATARLVHVITGTPDGEVRYATSVVDGRFVGVAPGDDPDADVVLTQAYVDAQQVARGEVAPAVSFMRGRTKVVGSMGTVMALMPVLDSDEYRTLVADVAAQTAF